MRIEHWTSEQRPASLRKIALILPALVLALLISTVSGFAQEKPTKTLYQRLGGYDVIAGIVDDFLVQARTDPSFARFGGGRAMDSLKRARQLIVDQICNLSGGPCLYIGRDMKTAHAGLKITDAEWETNIKMFKVSLNKLKVAEPEQLEFLALIEKLRPDVVEKPPEEKPKEGTPQAQR